MDVSEEEIDDFLEHHGVKGQKWGVRNKRIAKGAAIAGGVAVTAIVSSILARKGMVPVSKIGLTTEELTKVQRAVAKAAWQNPVHKNAAAEIRRFVSLL